MTDLEMTRFCAEAMGIQIRADMSIGTPTSGWTYDGWNLTYDPLHDDAQAMALVKKFGLEIQCGSAVGGSWWKCISFKTPAPHIEAEGLDLNRAICEYVAKIRKEKQ